MVEPVPPRPPDSLLATRWTRIGALHGRDAEAAWQWFVDRYRPFVNGILAGMLGRSQQATAAQEEFWGYVWMSGSLQRAEYGRRFRAFLSGIVRNFARSYARQRQLPLAAEDAIDTLPSGSDTAELQLWVENVIANALATLHGESESTCRALASFYGLEGGIAPGSPKSASEVAQALGNTAQGIYMLLFRGRKRLRELIESELREGCRDDDAWREEVQALLGVAAARLPGLLAEG